MEVKSGVERDGLINRKSAIVPGNSTIEWDDLKRAIRGLVGKKKRGIR